MRVFTEKKYQAMLAEHAFQVECSVSDRHFIESERDYYREARETAVNVANEARAEMQRLYRELAARITEVETMDSVIQYWMEQAEQARESRDEARAEIEKLKTGTRDLANAADAYRLERNAARAELAYYLLQLEQANSSVVANQNIAADRYMEIQTLKKQLEAVAVELGKLKSELAARPIAAELDAASKISADYNAAQADATLDSLDESGCECDMCADPTGIDEDEPVIVVFIREVA